MEIYVCGKSKVRSMLLITVLKWRWVCQNYRDSIILLKFHKVYFLSNCSDLLWYCQSCDQSKYALANDEVWDQIYVHGSILTTYNSFELEVNLSKS
jgi:hypothetical protein